MENLLFLIVQLQTILNMDGELSVLFCPAVILMVWRFFLLETDAFLRQLQNMLENG